MTIDDILNTAKLRGKQLGLPYAGALTPKEAHELMQHNANAKLVDVRTRAEWLALLHLHPVFIKLQHALSLNCGLDLGGQF